MLMAKTLEGYINSKKEWSACLELLREIFDSVELEETLKWGMPTYTLDNKNVVGFSAFKSYVGIWFFHGVFLADPEKKLVNAQEGITRGQRQWRFQNLEQIQENRSLILEYLEETIQNQKDGKLIKAEAKPPAEIPPELKTKLEKDGTLKDAFSSLTKSKQREYCEYIGQAKREETRRTRLIKICPMILEGVGLNDKYK